jgi:hypothetical protein
MTQSSNVICANYQCPLSKECLRFNDIPDGELHTYKVYQYDTNKETKEVSCKNFINYDTNREIHSSPEYR